MESQSAKTAGIVVVIVGILLLVGLGYLVFSGVIL